MKRYTIILVMALLAVAVIINMTRAGSPSISLAQDGPETAMVIVGQETSVTVEGAAPITPLDTEILLATADATVDAIVPDFSYGLQPRIGVGYNNTLDFHKSRALIRFNLDSIPANTVINGARLQVYVVGTTAADNVTLEVARMTEDWDEATVTWNNGHQDTIVDLAPPVTRIVGLATAVWVEWDVTALVQSWLDGDFPNYGLVLHGPEWSTEYAREFASRESADGSRASRLVVNYGPAAPDSDLAVDDVEVTQGIQCLDNTQGDTNCADNSVPLVEGRPTYVRVFVDTGAAVANVNNVNARLRRTIGGVPVYVYAFNGPIAARPVPNRGNTNHTLNFLLPHEWWTGAYNFDVELDPDNLIDETNEGNNSRAVEVSFNARKSLTIYYSPIYYDPEADGGAILPTNRIHTAYRWLYNTFPLADYPTYVEKPTYLWQRDVNVDDNDAELITFLYQLWTLDGRRDSTAYMQIYAGWLPANSYNQNGLSDPLWAGGTQIPVFVNDTDGNAATSRYRRTLAHEVAHNFNRYHVRNDDNWPYATNRIQETGFDIEYRSTVRSTKFDVMVGGMLESQAWVSPYTYQALYDWIGAPALAVQDIAAEEPVERALITGFIRRNGTGELNALYRYQALSPAGATPPGTDFCVRFRNAGGLLLAERCFDVSFAENDSEDPRDAAPFGLLEPWPANTAEIQLTKATTILDRLTVSAKPPTVQVEQPNGGELWDGTQFIKWHGHDPDGDPLTYAVLYSADEGDSWLSIATGLEATEIEVDSTVLPGSDRALIRVLATDGARTAEDLSEATFSVVRKPPTATIFLPESGDRFDLGDPVLLRGVGYDREDGRLEEATLTWHSDRDGLIGLGGTLVTTALSVGHHRLTFEVKDADNNIAQAMVEIDIVIAGADRQWLYLPLLLKSFRQEMSTPAPTPSSTPTPTPTNPSTPTPTNMFTSTPTPTNTSAPPPTPTDTSTPTPTPTHTSTPTSTNTPTPTPTTVILTPIADAYLSYAAPGTNYGTAPTLYVGKNETSIGRGLFQFDLSTIPIGATVLNADFQAALVQTSTSPPSLDVELKRVNDPWTEAGVTWNGQPGTTGIGKVNGVGTAMGYYAWDVAGLVQNWIGGTANHGLALWSYPETTFGWRGFASRESVSPPSPPRLVITYQP